MFEKKRVRKILIRAALRVRGFSDLQIDKAFAVIEADTGKPILDWLIDGGFEEILGWIIAIINLFAGMGDTAGAMGSPSPHEQMTARDESTNVKMPPVPDLPRGAIGMTVADGAVCIVIPIGVLKPLLG